MSIETPKPLKKTPEGKAPHEYIVTKEEAAKLAAQLPDKGFQREEELKKRADNLAAAKAELDADGSTMAIDPTAFKEEREILQHFTQDQFTGDTNPNIANWNTQEYVYKLVPCEVPRTSPHKEVYKAKRFGWELVGPTTCHTTGADGKRHPVGEGMPVHAVLNARYIGDTVLMFMPRARFDALQALEERAKMRLRMAAQATTLKQMQGARPHTELDDPSGYVRKLLQQGGGPVPMAPANTLSAEMARGIARQTFNDMLKDGTIPGMEVKR